MLGWRKEGRKDAEAPPAASTGAGSGAAHSDAGDHSEANPAAAAGSSPLSRGKLLGDMLFEEGRITHGQLEEALAKKDKDGTFVGKALVDLGYIDQKTLLSFLVKQCKIPHISLLDYEINGSLLKLIPQDVCLKHHLLPIDKLGRILTVAMVDPLDPDALEHVRTLCPELKVKPILCDWDHFDQVARRLFGASSGPQEELTARSFGLAEKPAQAAPPPEPPAGPSAEAGHAAVDAAVDELLQQQAAPTPPKAKRKPAEDSAAPEPEPAAPAPAPAPMPAVAMDQLASQMRAGVEQVMQRAVDDLAAQLKQARTEAPVPAGPSPQELARMVHENVQEAVQQTLAPVLAKLDEGPREQAPALPAQDLAAAIGESVREAVQGTVGALARDLHEAVKDREPAAGGPSVQELAAVLQEGVRGAMQEAVAAVVVQTNQSLSAPAAAPSGAELGETIRSGVQSAMKDVVSALADHTRQIVGAQATPAGSTAQDIAEAVRTSMSEAMKEVSAAMAAQTRQMAALAQADDGPAAEELAAMLGGSVRGAMQEALQTIGADLASRQNDAPLQEALAVQAAQAAKTAEDMRQALEAMNAAMQATQAAQSERESRLAELLESALKTRPAEPAPEAPASSIEPFPAKNARRSKATDEKYASVTLLRRREEDAVEALRESGAMGHADERVRAALESETPLEGYSFENYLVGKANGFTVALAKAVAENPGREYNPLFLYGDVGTGKTHLINATANQVQLVNRDMRVGYVSAGRFARRLNEAIKDNQLDAFRENYCHCDLLVFDDIQFLAGHDDVQEEFFHIFNALQLENRQIILAADKAPDKLGQLEKRLVSRFSGGIVASLVPPDWETRMRILRRQAQESLIAVPEDILALLATRVPGDVRKMTGCLRKVIAFAKLMDRELTCDLAGEILAHLGVTEAA